MAYIFFSFCLFYFAGFVIFLINVPKSPRGENDYSSIYPLFGNPEKYAYKLKSLKSDLFISKTISLALCIFTNSSCWQPFMFKIVEQLHCVCEFNIYMNSTVLGTHHNVCKAYPTSATHFSFTNSEMWNLGITMVI